MVLRYSGTLNGLTSLVVTKLDVLDELAEIPVCVGYRYKGTPIQEMPPAVDVLGQVEPVYEARPGWRSTTRGLDRYEELPPQAQDYRTT
jgi:adenylosuccinate synthase